jgi:hypothetical protein
MKNIPEQIKMLKELRDSESISNIEYQEMLDIILSDLEDNTNHIHAEGNEHLLNNNQEDLDISLFPLSTGDYSSLYNGILNVLFSAQLYNLLFLGLICCIIFLWEILVAENGFWENYLFFFIVIGTTSTVIEARIVTNLYQFLTSTFNNLFSKFIDLKTLVGDNYSILNCFNGSGFSKNWNRFNTFLKYFVLYRFYLILFYELIIVNLFRPISLFENFIAFEKNDKSGQLIYFEMMLFLSVKVLQLVLAFKNSYNFLQQVKTTYNDSTIQTTNSLNNQLKFYVEYENLQYKGPLNHEQIKLLRKLNVVKKDRLIKNGYGTSVVI